MTKRDQARQMREQNPHLTFAEIGRQIGMSMEGARDAYSRNPEFRVWCSECGDFVIEPEKDSCPRGHLRKLGLIAVEVD